MEIHSYSHRTTRRLLTPLLKLGYRAGTPSVYLCHAPQPTVARPGWRGRCADQNRTLRSELTRAERASEREKGSSPLPHAQWSSSKKVNVPTKNDTRSRCAMARGAETVGSKGIVGLGFVVWFPSMMT